VNRSYRDELAGLPTAYSAALAVPNKEIERLRDALTGAPAVFVGAGGALSCAKFGAEMHERLSGSMARAATPLEVASQPPPDCVTVVLISARARHPDTAAAAAAALAAGNCRILLLTQRSQEELSGSLADSLISYHKIPIPDGRYDGFLATRSLLSTATLLARAYSTNVLPIDLPSFGVEETAQLRDRLLVLSAPNLAPIAYDLEARFNETGLADVELTDLRNFGHGRHYGFSQRIDKTTVVAVSNDETRELTDRTLAVLPSEAQVIRLHSDLQWPTCILDLLVRSARLVQDAARDSNIDPAKPTVPQFGRRLYHLNPRALTSRDTGPIQRKLREAVTGGPYEDVYNFYNSALQAWKVNVQQAWLSGLVLDYDGTVCATNERYALPRESVRVQIQRLLSSGIKIAFGSGRGSSLYKDLRNWVPQSLWGQVLVGLYNGAFVIKLSDEFPSQDNEREAELAQAFDRLQEAHLSNFLELKLRKYQLSVQASGVTKLGTEALYAMVSSVLSRQPELRLSILTSGHSIDVVQQGVAKTLVHQALAAAVGGGELLAIGDQGQVGGNDHTLLAYSVYTLSVDRCSPDPTRCWNIANASERGPEGLVRYLKAIKAGQGDYFQLIWEN
jgi:fructoselysine-6-P-deglycase FrlB-like protein/hydroxymethylpyrimidine pyrophosphatase-like HAD family hydrolase